MARRHGHVSMHNFTAVSVSESEVMQPPRCGPCPNSRSRPFLMAHTGRTETTNRDPSDEHAAGQARDNGEAPDDECPHKLRKLRQVRYQGTIMCRARFVTRGTKKLPHIWRDMVKLKRIRRWVVILSNMGKRNKDKRADRYAFDDDERSTTSAPAVETERHRHVDHGATGC
ncbi:hypothetical protein OH76DRAFT_1424352 [Lentinus brumalis]|uniref:Uncharacterized protein n=1 Tax=Lentinus brumalis TaxID=2498619 RepID=A0A371CGK4_9APHY|nr:hypothetical protein OH76DRAFT_1424352 [Polyporus brumalis]